MGGEIGAQNLKSQESTRRVGHARHRRTLTDAGIDPKHADAITAAVRQAADQGSPS